jgi:MraZ protein
LFFGESSHSLDDKGRVFVPKRFLEELSRGPDGALVAYLTRGQDACLYLFSETGFQRAVAELSTSVFSGEDARGVMRAFFANTARVDLDASGRVLIPEKLRVGAGLEKDVVVVGVGDRAEIWSRKVWTPYEAANLAKLDHIDRVLAGERTKVEAKK